jgi:hypothetical protein
MSTHNTREGIEELKNEFIQEYKAGHKDGGMRSYLFTGQNGSLIADWWIKKINLIEQTHHQELQKARADSYVEGYVDGIGVSGLGMPEDKKEELRQTIIDRYQEELDQPTV